jgi:hypothetical protein
MLPRWHLILGIAFTLAVWIAAPQIHPAYLILVFFGTFFIDFDHYTNSVLQTKKWSLKNALKHHEKLKKIEKREIASGIKKKGNFHLFHTVEFHIFIGALGLIFLVFFYVFLGMVFHSLLDLIDLLVSRRFHRREYFFFNWLRKKF